MKTLILTRHAKSSWKTGAQTDFDRPLNERGLQDAPLMAKRLRQHGPLPQLVVSSTAVRAMKTTELLMHTLALRNDQRKNTKTIYEAPLRSLLDCAIGLPNNYNIAMLVGHNPGMSSLCNYLCDESQVQMPTCAMACLELDIEDWNDIYQNCSTLRWYDYPKR